MAQESKHYMNEPDIGSGEKTPGQEDVERDEMAVKATGPLAERQESQQESTPGRILQSGDHIARILAVKQPDDMFEAQVFVRLAREPEVAETYIPAGTYGTEAEAWKAAEARANRAFTEHEF